MQVVTQADRDAARVLREALADISGFWYRLDDDAALCQALARHRIQGEQRHLRQTFPEAQAVPLMHDGGAAEAVASAVRRLRATAVPSAGLRLG